MSKIPRPRVSQLTMLLFAVLILVPSLLGFATKFIEFVAVFRGDAGGRFAISPIINYLFATLGFLCLFGWAAVHGMLRDIEAPKYRMLEIEDQLDRATPPSNTPIGR